MSYQTKDPKLESITISEILTSISADEILGLSLLYSDTTGDDAFNRYAHRFELVHNGSSNLTGIVACIDAVGLLNGTAGDIDTLYGMHLDLGKGTGVSTLGAAIGVGMDTVGAGTKHYAFEFKGSSVYTTGTTINTRLNPGTPADWYIPMSTSSLTTNKAMIYQDTTSGLLSSGAYWDSARMGIGSSTPRETLHVFTGTATTSPIGGTDRGIALTSDIAGYCRYFFEQQANTSGSRMMIADFQADLLNIGSLPDNASGWTHQYMLAMDPATGNIGTGTGALSCPFHVSALQQNVTWTATTSVTNLPTTMLIETGTEGTNDRASLAIRGSEDSGSTVAASIDFLNYQSIQDAYVRMVEFEGITNTSGKGGRLGIKTYTNGVGTRLALFGTSSVDMYVPLTLSDNLAVDTDTLLVDSVTHRVGVGNPTPDVLFHVETDSATPTEFVTFSDTLVTNSRMTWGVDDGTNYGLGDLYYFYTSSASMGMGYNAVDDLVFTANGPIFNAGNANINWQVNYNPGTAIYVQGSDGRIGFNTETLDAVSKLTIKQTTTGFTTGANVSLIGSTAVYPTVQWAVNDHSTRQYYNAFTDGSSERSSIAGTVFRTFAGTTGFMETAAVTGTVNGTINVNNGNRYRMEVGEYLFNVGSLDVDFIVRATGFSNAIRVDGATGRVSIGWGVPPSRFHVYEETTETGAAAGVTIEQSSTGDAVLQFLLTAGQRYVMGIDNSDADSFKIATSADVGTDTALTIDTTGNVTLANDLIIAAPTVPATATSTGTTGQISWDADYIYICTATNTWKRVAIATW